MIQAPFNNLLVTIETKYIENFTNMLKAAAINHGSQINPADYVQIIGTIESLPQEICNRREYKGYTLDNIKVGDKAIFRYDVVFDFLEQEDGSAKFKNMFWYKGKEYWTVDIQKLFAVIRGNQIIMVNGYCMLEDMTKPPLILLPQHMKRMATAAKAILTHIGNPMRNVEHIKAEEGDTVFYNPFLVQQYKIKDKEFGIIPQHHILGIEIPKINPKIFLN